MNLCKKIFFLFIVSISNIVLANEKLCLVFDGELCYKMNIEAVLDETIFLDALNKEVVFISNADIKKIHNGYRSEISLHYPYIIGGTVSYKFKIMIPSSFSISTKSNFWFLLAQWHDQPNILRGETWKNFPHNSPPLSLQVERVGNDYFLSVQQIGQEKFTFSFPFDQWISMSFTVTWSNRENGIVVFESLGHKKEFTGKNMLNDYWHYFKFGIYRAPVVLDNLSVYFKDLIINTIDD